MNAQDRRRSPDSRAPAPQTPAPQTPAGPTASGPDQGQHLWPSGGPEASHPLPGFEAPETRQVLDLIQRAEQHELGCDFLAKGAPDAVAATFGVHAFLVDAARDHLTGTEGE